MMYLIIKDCSTESKLVEQELPNTEYANAIMLNEDFIEYIKQHGYHFSESLSEYASSLMENANNAQHRWIPKEVREALVALGETDFNMSTTGDLTYLANMAYADFYPDVLTNETACIKYAYAVAHDKDGYDGIAFSRWLADIIGKHITDILWENYI